MAMFETLIADTLAHPTPVSWQPLPLPAEAARATSGAVVLETTFRLAPGYGELRAVHIGSPRVEIVNLFLFPWATRAAPVFAMEFVRFGPRPVVAVIDAPTVTPHAPQAAALTAAFAAIQAARPEVHWGGEMPPWYLECRSGWDLFARPESVAELPALVSAHHAAWAAYAEQLWGAGEWAAQGDAATAHGQAVEHYKHHHCANSPGLPFLTKTFGADWTAWFTQQVLFGPPGGCVQSPE